MIGATLLVQGMADSISCICCHPTKTLVALCCYNGTLHVWDYDMKLLMNLREFNTRLPPAKNILAGTRVKPTDRLLLRPQCVSFDPSGEFIAVGFTSGDIRFLNSETFSDILSFSPSADTILQMKFSASGQYMAAYDSSNHVIILKRNDQILTRSSSFGGEEEGEATQSVSKDPYIYLGRALTHTAPITGIEFGVRENGEALISVGEDRWCVEYDLSGSSVKTGVKLAQSARARIELTARPTAILWHPQIGDDIEDRFIVANDEFKLKEFNADSKQCRKTTLAPTFGGPPNQMIALTINGVPNRYVYSTAERIVGFGCLPLTGDPTQVMGLVAHPSRITSIATSFDGRFLFTAGGADLTAGMFSVDISAVNQSADENTLPNFLELLEGGSGGELHSDLIDYFYLCQLRTQGENTMDSRAIVGHIPIEEISSLVRSVGFYPSEEEIENMANEIRYKNFMMTGVAQETISLDDVIKLYINHRPVGSLSSADIDTAFEVVRKRLHSSNPLGVSFNDLKNLLMSEGEALIPSELEEYLTILMGEQKSPDDEGESTRPVTLNASSFATHVLGFEDFN